MAIEEITPTFINNIADKVRRNKRVRRKLPGDGKLSIERQLPFLVIYRFRKDPIKDPVVRMLLTGSSYLLIPAQLEYFDQVKNLIRALADVYTREFKSFLLLEVWPSNEEDHTTTFHIKCPDLPGNSSVEELHKSLETMTDIHPATQVERDCVSARQPDDLPAFFTPAELKELEILLLGIAIPQLYIGIKRGEMYPVFFRHFRTRFNEAVQKMLFDFIRVQTTFDVSNYYELGRSQIDSGVWYIDRQLAEIERSFQFLLLVNPINSEQEWTRFQKNDYQKNPDFHYRLLPIDPDNLKRKLYNLKISNINDPALAYLFRDKREELEIQLNMLAKRKSRDFLYNGLRLYKGVDDHLLRLAKNILSGISPMLDENKDGLPDDTGPLINAQQFAEKAREEYNYYRNIYPEFNQGIQIRKDIPGLMVSQGELLIPEGMLIKASRLEALIHHEVGTHVLTFVNGSHQPLQQLKYGLADYDELQEGLAVLAEYMVGGLDSARLRLLAGRVVAARSLVEGAEFVDTFNLLHRDHDFSPPIAWDITTRIHQSGGFIKDVIYLRGLVDLITYLEKGGELEPLYIGKIASKHIPIITELQARQVLKSAPLLPRFFTTDDARRRLEKVKQGISLTELIDLKQTA